MKVNSSTPLPKIVKRYSRLAGEGRLDTPEAKHLQFHGRNKLGWKPPHKLAEALWKPGFIDASFSTARASGVPGATVFAV